MNEIHAISIYFFILILIAIASAPKKSDVSDFFIGRRSMNFWLTALSAHASDMSSWLFMAFPATIFVSGLFKAWVAIGLLIFMYLNWQFIAPRIRIATERLNSLTFFSYIENRFKDPYLRLYCTVICFLFYSVYIASGFMGMGLLIEKIYGFSYLVSLIATVGIALLCVIAGGYRTLAWIDLSQGCFLLAVLLFVPFFIMHQLGGWSIVQQAIAQKHLSLSLLPDGKETGYAGMILMIFGWGLGYFGQPAIITKFMGIQRVEEMHRSKYVGMIWMLISLAAATLVGLVAIGFFQESPENIEMIFIHMVKASFHPFVSGFILCAVFAATINVISSQILVIGSSFFEDIYQRFSKNNGDSLLVTRVAIGIACSLSFLIAYCKVSSIYSLVLYAWSGLGSAFGPLLIFSLYSSNTSRKVGWAAVVTGSVSSAIWPWIDQIWQTSIDPMVIGFSISSLAIFSVAYWEKLTRRISVNA